MDEVSSQSSGRGSWALGSAMTLLGLSVVACARHPLLGLLYLAAGCIVHAVLTPLFWRRRMGHPSWLMAPTLLPLCGFFAFLAPYVFTSVWYARSAGGVAALVLTFLPCTPAILCKPTRAKWGFGAACLVLAVAMMVLVPFESGSRRLFLRDLGRVRAGMRVSEVEAIMADYMGGAGENEARQTAFTGQGCWRHSEGAAYGSDFGVVDFVEGRVVRVRFLAD